MNEPSVTAAAAAILAASTPGEKVERTGAAAKAWRDGGLAPASDIRPPERPGRPARPQLMRPRDMPKRGTGGQRRRIALIHAITHIEFNAIDLAWDMVARFGAAMPSAFIDDWVSVAADEARHFEMLRGRLAALGASYGDLPAHDGLWEAAAATADDLLARLAVVPMVLEARGLDTIPATVAKLQKSGDGDSAAILAAIAEDEIGHVGAGVRWFEFVCDQRGLAPAETFHRLVRARFRGRLKPPFNEPARAQAGLTPAYYLPLSC